MPGAWLRTCHCWGECWVIAAMGYGSNIIAERKRQIPDEVVASAHCW